MERIGSAGDQVTVRVSHEELRLLLGVVNEALHGAYAIPEDEWPELLHQPLDRGEALMDDTLAIVKQIDASAGE